ncbi:MAG TPA: flagellar hook-length control protein FliK [Lacipirellulaceae bacterium]
MTNQTNLDYLFKLTAPVQERGAAGSTSSNARRPAFDDLFLNASVPASGSPNTTAARTSPTESAPQNSGGRDNAARPDDGYVTDREPADNSAPVNAATSRDTNTKVADHEAADQAVHGDEGESAVNEASSEEEHFLEQHATEEFLPAALIVEHAGQTLQKNSTLEEDQLAKSVSDDDVDAERHAGRLPTGERSDLKRPRDVVPADAEIDISAQAQSVDSSASQLAGDKVNESNSAHAAEIESKQQESARERTGVNATAVDASAPATKTAKNAEPKPAKTITAERHAANLNKESAEERRAPAKSGMNHADANVSQNASGTIVVANVASANTATAAAAGEASEEASRAVKSIGNSADGSHLTARAQRSGASGSRRAHATRAPGLPLVDAARFVGRVAKAVQTAQDRGGTVQLRLSPPELGSLRLELSMQNGVMTAAVETETPAARQVLLDHFPALRERLAEQNIRIERFDVEVRQENSGGQADPRASQQEHRQQQPQQPHSGHEAGRPATTQSTTVDAPYVLTRLANSELNLLA